MYFYVNMNATTCLWWHARQEWSMRQSHRRVGLTNEHKLWLFSSQKGKAITYPCGAAPANLSGPVKVAPRQLGAIA